MIRAIQLTETAATWDEAYAMLRTLERQTDYLGGRVYPRGRTWHVQTFHQTNGEPVGSWLPDGARHVVIPPALAAALGIRA